VPSYVEYDWDADKLGLAIESMEAPDSSLLRSEVFSLTDMVPGAMVIDLICRREFDLSIVEYANGKPLNEILGISYKDSNGVIQHNPDRNLPRSNAGRRLKDSWHLTGARRQLRRYR
jgi:hypothetical protein